MSVELIVYLVLFVLIAWTVWPVVKEHEGAQQLTAFWKCASIWFISSLPIFFGIAISVSEGFKISSIFSDFSGSPFSWSEQLVYASTYLAPVIYAVAEALKVLSSDAATTRRRRFQRIFKTYWRVFFPSLLLLCVSIFAFSAIKIDPDGFKETLFFEYLEGKSIVIHIVAWIYWYCVVLIEIGGDNDGDYATAASQRTMDVTDAARARLGGGQS